MKNCRAGLDLVGNDWMVVVCYYCDVMYVSDRSSRPHALMRCCCKWEGKLF